MNIRHLYFIAAISFTVLTGLHGKTPIPMAPEHPDTTTIHGVTLVDNWAWLKNREHDELPSVLKKESRYAQANLKPSKSLSRKIYKEFTRFVDRVSESHPYLYHGFYYFTRETEEQSYVVHFRYPAGDKDSMELILDENQLAVGYDFFQAALFSISPNSRYLAYSADFSGTEQYRLYIKDLVTGTTKSTAIENLSQAIWLRDNRTILLTTVNSRLQTDCLWKYDTQTESLEEVYRESDPAFDLGIYSSMDKDLIFIQSSSKNTSQTWYLHSDDTQAAIRELFPRVENRQVTADYLYGVFYVLSDHENPDYAIYTFHPEATYEEAWNIMVAGRMGDPISSFVVFHDYLVVLRRHIGFPIIEIYDKMQGKLLRTISSAVPSDLDFWVNNDPAAPMVYYSRENELQPYSIICHGLATGTEEVVYVRQPAVQVDYTAYRIDLCWVDSDDGHKIPLRLIQRNDLVDATPHPLWLYTYGAYGDCEDPYFSTTLFSLLDRGYIYAVAHIRGGGELGKAWYDGGRGWNKVNTFTDFIDCIEYLQDSKLTTKDKLVIEGGSAGGLLIGATLNLAPDKVRVAIADVPFVDLINSMLDPDLPLTQQEYEEWGDPYDAPSFHYMLSYSPYDSVAPACYPNVIINTAWNDIRVGYWEGLKWAQKLRTNNTGHNPIIFRMLLNEGHTGTNDRYQSLRNYAELMAYAIHLVEKN